MKCPLLIWCALGLSHPAPGVDPTHTAVVAPAPTKPAAPPTPAPTPAPHPRAYAVNSTCCFGQNGNPVSGTHAATIGFTALGIASVAHAIATGHATAVGHCAGKGGH